jgi:glycosyltransferase involved in cell wall biosynthesis
MMVKVAFLLTQDRGGPVDVTVRLAATLHASGEHAVRVFGPTPARDHELLDGIHEHLVVDGKGSIGAVRAARVRIRAWGPEIVHAQDRRSGLVTAGMQHGRRGPAAVVHTYHGVPDDVGEQWFRGTPGAEPPSRYTRAVLAADAAVARGVTRTVVPATAMGEFLHRRLRLGRTRWTHIDNGVALPPSSPPPGPIRKLLFVGLLVPRKGLHDLLEAMALSGVLPADAKLSVAGDGPARRDCEDLARTLGLSDRVEFLGFRSDVPALLAQHDALVLPSRMEQQPLVIAEAMGAGKPVLATETGGVPEMLDLGGHRGYLSVPADTEALARSLQRLFAEPDPAGLGAQLAERARERYSSSACADAHLALYRSLIT